MDADKDTPKGVDYITALEYAKGHGYSKPWVVKLCQAGRIHGAYLAGGVWVMPANAPLPSVVRRGPKPVLDETAAQEALARLVPVKVTRVALEDGLKQWIEQRVEMGCEFNAGGSHKTPDGKWMMRPSAWAWTPAAWAFYQSIAADVTERDDDLPDARKSEIEAWVDAGRHIDAGGSVYAVGDGDVPGPGGVMLRRVGKVADWCAADTAYYKVMGGSLVPK